MKTTDLKTNYIEIKKTNRDTYILCWDKVDIEETDYATWNEVELMYKPTIEQVRTTISDAINKETDQLILNGFTWQAEIEGVMTDIQVYLSSENQFNYKAAYDIAFQTQGASLPFVLKFGDVTAPRYYTFTTLESFTQFYLACITFINSTLQQGWEKKDNIDYTPYEIILNTI